MVMVSLFSRPSGVSVCLLLINSQKKESELSLLPAWNKKKNISSLNKIALNWVMNCSLVDMQCINNLSKLRYKMLISGLLTYGLFIQVVWVTALNKYVIMTETYNHLIPRMVSIDINHWQEITENIFFKKVITFAVKS